MNPTTIRQDDEPVEDESRDWTDRKATAQALRAANARNSSGRRRFVDPDDVRPRLLPRRARVHAGHARL